MIRWDSVLTPELARWAYRQGLARAQKAMRLGRAGNYDFTPTVRQRLHTDGMAATAEFLASVYTHRGWISRGTTPDRGRADLDGGIEVRWTPLESGCLIVHKEDADDHMALLAVGDGPCLALVGWYHVRNAKDRKFWRSKGVRNPAYFVPQQLLSDPYALVVSHDTET